MEQPKELAQGLARAYLLRARNILSAAHAVAKLGLPAEVLALARVLCESYIQLEWVKKGVNPDERAQILCDESIIHEHEAVLTFVSHSPAAKDMLSEQQWREKYAEYNAARQRLKVKPGKKHRGKSVADCARESGTEVTSLYEIIYREMCAHAHPSMRSLQDAHDEPSEQEMDKALFLSIHGALILMESCESLLGLPGLSTLKAEAMPILERSGVAVHW